ncbi:MAG: energy transducer TonB [Sphingobacteriia bacterium]|nr:MAG: energy transducer TonB [Sphingobacteriia bacterium]
MENDWLKYHSNKSIIMETQSILQSDFLDILFDGKNKNYGAYDLRKTYDQRIKIALITTCTITAIIVALVISENSFGKPAAIQQVVDVQLSSFKDETKKIEPPPPKKIEKPIKTIAVTPPLIVRDKDIDPLDEVKPIEEIEDTRIGNYNQEGEKSTDIVEAPVEKSGTGVKAIHEEEETDKVFTVVQIAAEFPGGLNGWAKYLQRNLNSALPVENGAPAGKYTVVVSFIVSKDGTISDVVAENDPGYGTKAEALRVIARGPNWKPAVQNGRNVIYRHKQSITFQVAEDL